LTNKQKYSLRRNFEANDLLNVKDCQGKGVIYNKYETLTRLTLVLVFLNEKSGVINYVIFLT